MKLFKKAFAYIVVILIIAGVLFMYFNAPVGRGKELDFEVRNGENLSQVAYRLKEQKLTQHHLFFYYLGRIHLQLGHKLHRGKYKLKDDLSTFEILTRFLNGDSEPDQIVLTIPEGYNIYDIADILFKKNIIKDKKDFLKLAFSKKLLKKYSIRSDSLEGYLYPTTYFVSKTEKADSLVKRMLNEFFKQFPDKEFKASREKLKMSRDQVLTIASLIEKETGVSGEREIVSSVYHNRIKKNMKMECDPTVIYALLRANKYTGKLRPKKGEMRFKSPYNTYVNKGLPPTPIANPSREAILAALNPTDTEYIYFVAKDDKAHRFAKTMSQHNKNIGLYRKWHRKQRIKQKALEKLKVKNKKEDDKKKS